MRFLFSVCYFQNTFILFSSSQELFFSHFKIQFCHICLRSRHTSYFHKLYCGVRETNVFLFSLYLYVKNGSSQEVNSPWAISLVTPCQVAADLPLNCRYIHFYADSASQSPIYCKKVWAQPAHSLRFSSSDNHKCVVLRCTVVYCKRVERQVIYGLVLDLLSISWKPVSARNWQSQLHLLFLVSFCDFLTKLKSSLIE